MGWESRSGKCPKTGLPLRGGGGGVKWGAGEEDSWRQPPPSGPLQIQPIGPTAEAIGPTVD